VERLPPTANCTQWVDRLRRERRAILLPGYYTCNPFRIKHVTVLIDFLTTNNHNLLFSVYENPYDPLAMRLRAWEVANLWYASSLLECAKLCLLMVPVLVVGPLSFAQLKRSRGAGFFHASFSNEGASNWTLTSRSFSKAWRNRRPL